MSPRSSTGILPVILGLEAQATNKAADGIGGHSRWTNNDVKHCVTELMACCNLFRRSIYSALSVPCQKILIHAAISENDLAKRMEIVVYDKVF